MLVHDRERDRAGARADVEHRRLGDLAQVLETALDDDLRLGPGNERTVVYLQRQPAEAPFAEHVGERLAAAAAIDENARAAELVLRERAVVLEIEVEPGDAERVGEEMLGVEARRVHALRGEVVGRAGENLPDRHCSSARRRSSAASASVNWSRSPWRIWSSRCTVSLIRWSVSRFSGKL